VSDAVYDSACKMARRRGVSLSAVVRVALSRLVRGTE
jgi:hypothetical protein